MRPTAARLAPAVLSLLAFAVSPAVAAVRYASPDGPALGASTFVQPCALEMSTVEGLLLSIRPEPTPEPSATPSPTPEPSATPSPTPEPSATPRPTPEPSATPRPTPEPSATPSPTPEPSATPSPTPEPSATPSPTPEPSATPSPTPEPCATPSPTPEPHPTPTPTPGPKPKPDGPTPEKHADPKGKAPEHAPAHGLKGTVPGNGEGAAQETPAPVLGKTVVVAAAAGTVVVRAPGAQRFVALDGSSPVPSGSLVDTRNGTVSLSSALDASGRTQTGRFRGALFVVRQSRTEKGMTELLLRGGDFGACRAAAARGATASAAAKRKPRRRLWSSDKGGRFRTQGRNSVATARGTAWLTEDTCAGTRVKVSEGAVEVRPLRGAGKPVLVKAGRQHLVRSRRR